jgi:hypothetical protein
MTSLYQFCNKCNKETSHKVKDLSITCIKCGKETKVNEVSKHK